MHVAAAAVGLSAVLVASATAFTAVKWLGAAYLVYLGVRRILDRTTTAQVASGQPPRLRRAFLDGVVVNTLNPKTALFFLAFLPQFVDLTRGRPGSPDPRARPALRAAGHRSPTAPTRSSAGTAARWLRGRPRFLAGERWVSGGVYIGLGVVAAVSSARPQVSRAIRAVHGGTS